MKYQLVFRPELISDLSDAVAWYENQVPGLGDRFLNEYLGAEQFIRDSAGAPGKVFENFRRVLLNKFPFAVWYEIDEKSAIILLPWDCPPKSGTARENASLD